MGIYDFQMLNRNDLVYLKNKQVKAGRTELLGGKTRTVTYIPGIGQLVIGDGGEYTVIDKNGSAELFSARKMVQLCRTMNNDSGNDSSSIQELLAGLLKYLSPGSTLRFTSALSIFDEDSFARTTLNSISKHIELEYREEPLLYSGRYRQLLEEHMSKESVIRCLKSDFMISRKNSFRHIAVNRAKEEKQKLLSIGSTRNRSAIRNTAVELLCRIHIDCGGYLTTDACMTYISEIIGIDGNVGYSTFRSYVDEARNLFYERGLSKSELWAVPILP